MRTASFVTTPQVHRRWQRYRSLAPLSFVSSPLTAEREVRSNTCHRTRYLIAPPPPGSWRALRVRPIDRARRPGDSRPVAAHAAGCYGDAFVLYTAHAAFFLAASEVPSDGTLSTPL